MFCANFKTSDNEYSGTLEFERLPEISYSAVFENDSRSAGFVAFFA